MNTSKKFFEQLSLLSFGKAISISASFIIPFFLGRTLSVESYGAYKQVMLIFWFALIVFNMGMDSSLFYFMKRNEKSLPTVSLNITFSNMAFTAILSGMLILLRSFLAKLLHNPNLNELMPYLCAILIFAVPSQHFEEIFVGLGKIRYKIFIDIIVEVLKATSIVLGYYLTDSLPVVLSLLALIFFFKFVALIIFNLYLTNINHTSYHIRNSILGEQLRYALPIGMSNIINFTLDLEKMLISIMFNLYSFTIYAVGQLEFPLISAIRNNTAMLMNIGMLKAKKTKDSFLMQDLWRTSNRKFLLIQIPFSIFMIFNAKDVICFIFSDKYAASAIYFQIFNLITIINAFAPDIVFFVSGKTRLHFRIQALSLPYRIVFIVIAAKMAGPIGAIIGKLLGNLVLAIIKISYSAKILGLNFKNLFMWNQVSSISIISIFCTTFNMLTINIIPLKNAYHLLLSFSFFTLEVFVLSLLLNIIKDDEKAYLFSIVQNLKRRAI